MCFARQKILYLSALRNGKEGGRVEAATHTQNTHVSMCVVLLSQSNNKDLDYLLWDVIRIRVLVKMVIIRTYLFGACMNACMHACVQIDMYVRTYVCR